MCEREREREREKKQFYIVDCYAVIADKELVVHQSVDMHVHCSKSMVERSYRRHRQQMCQVDKEFK